MKKTISITINGFIFHIEEDGYESLRNYLNAITQYFSSFNDSKEIIADLESRIAEIFSAQIRESKQVITDDDVTALIATMGSVSDFKAEEYGQLNSQQTAANNNSQKTFESETYTSNESYKKLLRDKKHKIIGGVCAGLGVYLNINPVWIRLIFVLLTFVYGITFIVYLVMWIVVPSADNLEEPVESKKIFRDSDNKIIGGVSGGVALFLNMDITVIRVLFVALTFIGGFGLFIYLVLWVILPLRSAKGYQ